jgi:hypothetical protein
MGVPNSFPIEAVILSEVKDPRIASLFFLSASRYT